MNLRALELGMVNSEFHTVHGLPAGRGQQPDVTTARDMAILGRELLKHPAALVWSSQATAPFRDGKFTLYNPNKLVGKFRGLDGLKTGYHGQAGFCVTATAVQKDVRLLSVVMGCPTNQGRATETTRLLSYGFNRYRKVTVVPEAGAPVETPVAMEGGKQSELTLVYANALEVAVPQDREGDVELRNEVAVPVAAPVAEGEKVGEAVATLDGFELGRVDLLAAETVEEGNWFHRLFH
jgi:D-alanyl-D-alanine carboxypeptidase (penicillin-binding protein 5/6)